MPTDGLAVRPPRNHFAAVQIVDETCPTQAASDILSISIIPRHPPIQMPAQQMQ
jgi:hypothetical protein